jgi:hypothetical protein
MLHTNDRDLPTTWDVTLGIGRDWARTITFVDVNEDPYPVDAADVEAVIDLPSGPLAINVAQGAASNVIILSMTEEEIGSAVFSRQWWVSVNDKRMFQGRFRLTSDSKVPPGGSDFTVLVGDDVFLTAIVQVPTSVSVEGGGTAADVSIADAGGYFTSATVETALQEIGETVATVYVWDGDSYEAEGGRIFVGPIDPSTVGFTMADGDKWEPTS